MRSEKGVWVINMLSTILVQLVGGFCDPQFVQIAQIDVEGLGGGRGEGEKSSFLGEKCGLQV